MAIGGHTDELEKPCQLVYDYSRRGRLPVHSYLGLCGEFVEIDITPALITPKWCERTAQAGVEGNEAPVLLPQVALFKDFPKRAEIIACVITPDDTDVWLVRDEADAIGVIIEDEDEIRCAM